MTFPHASWFVSVVAMALMGCSSSTVSLSGDPEWWHEVAWEAGTKVGGCAVGDFDPAHPGAEIAVVAADGRVIAVRRDGNGWAHEVIATLPGEPIQCAIGDCRPDLPGNELVAVGALEGGEDDGGPGAFAVFARVNGSWQQVEQGTQPALIHAVAIGDADSSTPGDELVVAGFAREVSVSTMAKTATGALERVAVAGSGGLLLPGNAKGATVGQGGVVVACDDGSLMRAGPAADGWAIETLAHWPDAGLARVAAHDGGILVCANDGVLRYWRRLGDGVATITDSPLKIQTRLRGAVIADLAAEVDGFELASAGYDGVVYVILVSGTMGNVLITHHAEVARDDDKLHHLAAGELPGLGTCLVAVGYSGRVTVAGSRPR